MLLQDFAENRKTTYGSGEVKSAFYGKQQIQLHPTVAFYKDHDDRLVRHTREGRGRWRNWPILSSFKKSCSRWLQF